MKFEAPNISPEQFVAGSIAFLALIGAVYALGQVMYHQREIDRIERKIKKTLEEQDKK